MAKNSKINILKKVPKKSWIFHAVRLDFKIETRPMHYSFQSVANKYIVSHSKDFMNHRVFPIDEVNGYVTKQFAA